MKRISKLFRHITLQQRLIFGFIVFPLLILILCSILNYTMNTEMIFEKNAESSLIQLEMAEENLYLNTRRLEDEGREFKNNPAIVKLYENQINTKEFKEVVDKEGFMKAGNLKFIDNQGSTLFQQTHCPEVGYPSSDVIVQADRNQVYVNEQRNGIFFFIHLKAGIRSLGYMCYGVPVSDLSPSLNAAYSEANTMLVVDENKTYLFGNMNIDKGYQIINDEGKTRIKDKIYLVQEIPSRISNWHVMSLASHEYVMEEVNNSRNVLLIYAVILAFVSFLFTSAVFQSIYDPLSKILNSMRKLDQNHIENHMVIDEGNDELHELSTNFNNLLSWVKDLLNRVEMEQEKKRETQIQLLQAQINPHFLFNTLNTLNYLALINNDKPVSEGISALSKLLRNTIVDRNEYVDVEEEIENLKNYIIIQKLRYGDLFETVYHIDEDVKQCRIMKFLLQPIVENSILHAFEEDRENQMLYINASHRDSYLEIEIADNGKGFETSESISKTRLSGIGIHNIEERIKLMYGDKFSMQIQSEVGTGTITTLRLPYIVQNRK